MCVNVCSIWSVSVVFRGIDTDVPTWKWAKNHAKDMKTQFERWLKWPNLVMIYATLSCSLFLNFILSLLWILAHGVSHCILTFGFSWLMRWHFVWFCRVFHSFETIFSNLCAFQVISPFQDELIWFCIIWVCFTSYKYGSSLSYSSIAIRNKKELIYFWPFLLVFRPGPSNSESRESVATNSC